MRIVKMFLLTGCCFMMSFGFSAYAADVAKIGVINFQRILEASSAGKYAQAEINKRGKKMESDLKKKEAEIEVIKKRLEREALVMSKEMREEKEREIRININDFKILQKKYVGEFKAFENRLVNLIQQEVLGLVRKMGKSGGYLFIVEQRTGEVLYYPKSVDATDEIIKKFNVDFAKKQAAGKTE